MDRVEVARQVAARLHADAVARGLDPSRSYDFAVAEARRRDLDVEATAPDAALLKRGRAVYVRADALILHENVGTAFDRAFLVAHELGHAELGDGVDPSTEQDAHLGKDTEGGCDVDPERSGESSPVGVDRVVDYGRLQRREVQMDLFAREFLLPRPVVRRMHLEDGLTASAIAEHFGAPFAVAAQQLIDALLLPPVPGVDDVAAASPPERPLNPEQADAARHRGRAFLLEAGPGTGKTQTLVGRVHSLLDEGVDARRVLLLTFSNKAAGEMAERIARRRPDAAAAMWIGTFHAFGLDLVRRFHAELGLPKDPRLMDRVEAAELLEEEFPRLGLVHYRDLFDPTQIVADVLAAISRAKDEVVDADGYAALASAMLDAAVTPDARVAAEKAMEVARVYAAYEGLKRRRHLVDFGDLVALPVRLLEGDAHVRALLAKTYEHVLVDEYQDVNRASVRLLVALRPDGEDLWAVGDARQSIYRFRGASSFNMARFGTDDFAGGVRGRLTLNYRSVREIVDSFSAFAADMRAGSRTVDSTGTRANVGTQAIGGALSADRDPAGRVPELHAVAQGEQVPVALADAIETMRHAGHVYRNQAVLCTGNERLSALGQDLERLGVPVLFLGSLFERPEVKDLLALLSMLDDRRAMGLVRTACWPEFAMSMPDVAAVLRHLRAVVAEEEGRGSTAIAAVPCAWLREALHRSEQPGDGIPGVSAGRSVRPGNAGGRPRGLRSCLGSLDGPRDRLARPDADRSPTRGVARHRGPRARDRDLAAAELPPSTACPARPPDSRPAGSGPTPRTARRRPRTAAAPGGGAEARRRAPDDRARREGPRVRSRAYAGGERRYDPARGIDTPCPPPDGMVAGGVGDALALVRAGHAEEQECLFYVALSRARDRLLLYAPTKKANGHNRPLSPFLDRLGPALVRRTVTPSRTLPPAPESADIALVWMGGARFTDTQIALYERCGRRFFYTHVLQLGGRRTTTAYMRLHEAVRAVVQSLVDGVVDGGPGTTRSDSITGDGAGLQDAALGDLLPEALERQLTAALTAQDLDRHGYAAEYRALARGMTRYFLAARADHAPTARGAVELRFGADEVVVRPDDVLLRADGVRVVRRVRTGHLRSSELKDVGAAAFLLAARQVAPDAVAEFVHLGDEVTSAVVLSARELSNRREKLAGFLSDVRAGRFPAEATVRTCPGCPAFFVCGPTPHGALEIGAPAMDVGVRAGPFATSSPAGSSTAK